MTVFLLKNTPGFEQKTLRILLMLMLQLFFFFCLLRSVSLLLFRLKTKIDQANKYDVLNFFAFSNELLNPGDCKSPPRRGNNTLTLPELYFY